MSSEIEYHDPNKLLPWANNARTHSKKQLRQMVLSDELEIKILTNR